MNFPDFLRKPTASRLSLCYNPLRAARDIRRFGSAVENTRVYSTARHKTAWKSRQCASVKISHDTFPSVKRVSKIDVKGGASRPKQNSFSRRVTYLRKAAIDMRGALSPAPWRTISNEARLGKTVAWAGSHPAFFTRGEKSGLSSASPTRKGWRVVYLD